MDAKESDAGMACINYEPYDVLLVPTEMCGK
jgi:hypothetical protein